MARMLDSELPDEVLEVREECLQNFREARDLKSAMFRSKSAYFSGVGAANPDVQSAVKQIIDE